MKHDPVLLSQVVNYWKNNQQGVFLDATFGQGGHSKALLGVIDAKSQLWAFDLDYEAVIGGQKLAAIEPRLRIIHTNFTNLTKIKHQYKIPPFDGILFDFGVSSPQLDQANRGFSYHHNGPLDMRMNQKTPGSALEVVAYSSLQKLRSIFKWYGETPHAHLVAKKIVFVRKTTPITTTHQLAEIIKSALPKKALIEKQHPARVFFQALRIHVNNELNNIDNVLNQLPTVMNQKGVVVILTFHSLEEKIVKNWIQKNCGDINLRLVPIKVMNNFQLITKKPITPTKQEINNNPRSRSAKMWVVRKN